MSSSLTFLSFSLLLSLTVVLSQCFTPSHSLTPPPPSLSLTCLEYIMSQALYESVILVGLEGRAVLGYYLVKPLDAAVAHSLIGAQYGNGIYG